MSKEIIIAQRDDGWLFFDRGDEKSCGDWRSLRLVNPGLRSGKRSYWLGWNHAEQRFARNADLKALTRKPELLEWVQTAGTPYYDGEFDGGEQ